MNLFRKAVSAARAAALIVGAAWVGSTAILVSVQAMAPAIAYAIPNTWVVQDVSLDIPDHVAGEDPEVTFRRTMYQTRLGIWSTEIIRDQTGAEVCRDNGRNIYQDNKNVLVVRLSEYVAGCHLNPGNYHAEVAIVFQVLGSSKEIRVNSNDFVVSARQ